VPVRNAELRASRERVRDPKFASGESILVRRGSVTSSGQAGRRDTKWAILVSVRNAPRGPDFAGLVAPGKVEIESFLATSELGTKGWQDTGIPFW